MSYTRKNCFSFTSCICFHLLLVLLFSTNAAFSGSTVKYLPGFDGELPFKLETGYVTVEESELFYYFIESEGNPKEDPLLLWYSGGPGCSTLNGLIYEIGPLAFNITAYEGGTPSLKYYPYSWTKSASILFIDAPVGTGFSYATNLTAYPTSDSKSAKQTYEFLRKWLVDHPQFQKVQLFIGADSYSGITAPIVVKHIVDGNKAGLLPRMNLKGYIVGCPETDKVINTNSLYIYSHRMGFISDELYEATKESCNGSYVDVDPNHAECFENLELCEKMIKGLSRNSVLEPKCTWASPESNGESDRRSLTQENPVDFILSPPKIPDFWCHNFNYALSYLWANDKGVQSALNVRPGTVKDWKRCNKTLSYTADVPSVLDVHRNLSKLSLQVLVYKYTIKYSENGYRLTYATVKGAGHSPQEYKRRECFDMFERFINYYPL